MVVQRLSCSQTAAFLQLVSSKIPAVETAPVQESASATSFRCAQETLCTETQPQPTSDARGATTTDFRWCTAKHNHSQLSLVHKRRNHSQLLRWRIATASSFFKCSGCLKHNQPCRGSNCSSARSANQAKTTLVFANARWSTSSLLTVNLFNQVKTFNLSMVKL